MEQATLNGTELPYEVTGSGEPLLLISTGPIADSFRPLVTQRSLTDRYRLIRYRQRRLTRVDKDPEPISFAQHAADAAALLAHLGIQGAHVAGHSTGAAIALQLAAEHPQAVHSLVLLEPPLLRVPSAAAFFDKAGPALAAYGAGDREAAMAGFMSVVCSQDWATCRALVDQHVPGGVAQAINDADNFFGSYLPALSAWQFGPEQAGHIAQPVLSVLGTRSDRLFAESHALLQAWLPQLEECVIDDVAHLLHLQRPEPVASGVGEFLARHPLQRHE